MREGSSPSYFKKALLFIEAVTAIYLNKKLCVIGSTPIWPIGLLAQQVEQ